MSSVIRIVVLIGVAVLILYLVSSGTHFLSGEDAATEISLDEQILVIKNSGSDRGGHTPRGFAGFGTGVFVGDNINPGFPNGDGVQAFLTFDVEGIDLSLIERVTLSSDALSIQGTPFEDLGDLRADVISFDSIAPILWNREPTQRACTFSRVGENAVECDVTEVFEGLSSGSGAFQVRLRFDLAGDGDGQPDMALFNRGDSNVNESGIFTLSVVYEDKNSTDSTSQSIELPVVLHRVLGNDEVNTRRSSENILEVFSESERIWDQADITFSETVRESTLEAGLAPRVARGEYNLLYNSNTFDENAINVYYVRSLNGINGIAVGPQLALVADITTVHDYRATAHEIGHLLGLPHVPLNQNTLMFQGANGELLSISEIEAARVNAKTFN